MSWRDRLQSASFRGIGFYVLQAAGSGGRNVAVHEFPASDKHQVDDLGKKAGQQSLQLFILGEDYDQTRDQLIKAFDKSGTGTLVHPYLGTMSIQVIDYDWRISVGKGGYCAFNLQYVKAGKVPAVPAVATAAALTDAADAAADNAETAFADKFSVDDQPAHVTDSATSFLEDATSALSTVNGKINSAVATVSDVATDINALADELATLVSAPATLISTCASVIASVIGSYNTIKSAFNAYDELLAGFSITSAVSTTSANGTETATRVAMAENQQAISTALITLATTSLVSFIAESDDVFSSYDEAVEIRDTLLDQIDELAENELLSYDEFNALKELGTALYNRVEEIAPGLSQLEYVQRSVSLPALVIAHQVYGDASRADELAERNSVGNPLFMPAGTDIEVLL